MAAKAPEVFAPSTPWNVHYADESCVLRRNFGTPDRKVFLELRQFAPGESFDVTVASKVFAVREGPAKVRFVPEEKPRTISRPILLVFPGDLSAVRWSDSLFHDDQPEGKAGEVAGQARQWRSDAAYKAREGAVRGMEIGRVLAKPIVLQTGEMHQPMIGMRTCLDKLVTYWGIDAAAQRTLSRPARPVGLANWARVIQANYPHAMLQAGKSGRVRVRLIVGIDGKPTSCHIQSVVQDISFGQTACSGMMKVARFEPALDAAGKPIASYFQTVLVYTVS